MKKRMLSCGWILGGANAGKLSRQRYTPKVRNRVGFGLLSLFLFFVFSTVTAFAKPKDAPAPISPSVGRDIEIQLVRGGTAELVLEGIAMPRDTVQFEVVKPPRHGALGEPQRISKDKVAFLYRHDGKKNGDQDRVDFRLKTGPLNAWGRVKAKIFISEPETRLVMEPESLDFGEVPIGAIKSLPLKLRNTGGGIITGTAEISPAWALDGDPAFSLGEGAFRDFSVTFAPSAPETQNGRIVFHTGQQPEPFVLLHGEGTYRFLAPPQVSISRDGENASGVLRLESQSKKTLELRLEAASPVLVPSEVRLQPGAMVEIPLGLEKKNYTESRVALTVSDGAAVREVRVNLPPPPAVLEWKEGAVLDIGGIPFRNVPEIEIGLHNAGASVAFVSLADGVGGLVLAPSQPQSFELAPGATALVRTVWKLPETPGEAEARITALEGGLAHPLKLLAQVEPPPSKPAPAPQPATTNAAPKPTPSSSRGILSKAESEDLKRRMPADISTRLVPEGGAATVIVTWKYRGPQPARFQLESRMAVREVIDPGKVFEKRLTVPEELPPAPVLAKWLPVEAAAIQQLDSETWQGRVPGLPGGYHPIRIGVRSPPNGKRIDYVEFPVFIGDLPSPAWMNWAWSSLGLICIFYLLRRKLTRKSQ